MQTSQVRMRSAIGPLYLVASANGLRGIYWKKQKDSLARSLKRTNPEAQALSRSVRQLYAYLNGKLKVFRLPLDASGTPFQKAVWRELIRIPYGTTRSYRDIARRIKNPRAIRAVGSAIGKNPLCIVIPCHRVISADGSLGGYSGGIGIKQKLLKIEGYIR
jgi:methylated-DNA-[protein]-cysteine S-methyltransferase